METLRLFTLGLAPAGAALGLHGLVLARAPFGAWLVRPAFLPADSAR